MTWGLIRQVFEAVTPIVEWVLLPSSAARGGGLYRPGVSLPSAPPPQPPWRLGSKTAVVGRPGVKVCGPTVSGVCLRCAARLSRPVAAAVSGLSRRPWRRAGGGGRGAVSQGADGLCPGLALVGAHSEKTTSATHHAENDDLQASKGISRTAPGLEDGEQPRQATAPDSSNRNMKQQLCE